jgi:KDO2-lipid IV(A) lauroyltransferase
MGQIGVFFLKLISHSPFWVIYLLSDLFYLILFKLLGYRKEVVYTNLRNSFPEKSEKQIDDIARKFYRFLGDLTLEGIKALTMSKEEVEKRMTIDLCPEYIETIKNNRHAILLMGHYGNWEYVNLRIALLEERQVFVGVYKKLASKAMDHFLHSARGRFGTDLAETKQVSKRIAEHAKNGTPMAIGLVTDQAPSKERGYWMNFLNQDTPVFLGAERFANRLNAPLFFARIEQPKRGFYHMSIVPSVLEPKEMEQGEITEIHTKYLEKAIQQRPDLWLWSHNRWKHKRPEGLPSEQISRRYPG